VSTAAERRGAPGGRLGLVLENERVVATVRPDLGGRIDTLDDRRTGKAWLYHPPRYDGASRALPVGTSFDDHWTGGLDEVFPNDAAGPFAGFDLVDHGELWSQAWDVIERSRHHVRLRLALRTVPVIVEKTVALDPARPEVRLVYRLEHLGEGELPYLFKQHAAVAVEPGDTLLLPDSHVEPVTLDFSTIIGREGRTPWPTARDRDGRVIRVDTVPRRGPSAREFVYASDLAEGWCGVRSARTGTALVFRFDRRQLPFVWLFQSYGGWRDHYVVVVEPASTMPYDLAVARERGTCAVLPAGGTAQIVVSLAIAGPTG
jgi:hypothetical protein